MHARRRGCAADAPRWRADRVPYSHVAARDAPRLAPFRARVGAYGAREIVWGCGEVEAGASFHELNVSDLQARPLNRLLSARTPLTSAFVAELTAHALPTAGLIFHMSRCGSTLVRQARWARGPARASIVNRACSIPPSHLAQAGYDRDGTCIRAVLAALAQPGDSDERVFIKLDAWHALALPLIVSIAQAPWLFVYRDAMLKCSLHICASREGTSFRGCCRLHGAFRILRRPMPIRCVINLRAFSACSAPRSCPTPAQRTC